MNLLRLLRFLLILAVAGSPDWAAPPTVSMTQVRIDGSTLHLEWQASRTGLQYTVETRHGLGPEDWIPWPGIAWPVGGTAVQLPEGAGGDRGFFRLRALPVPGVRGAVQSVKLVSAIPALQVQFLLSLQGISTLTPRNGVRFYQVIYETVDPHGFPTRASGGLAVPDGVVGPFPVVSYQHGTITRREDVPSRLSTEGLLGVILGSMGYVVNLPDYLGLGDSPGLHPYHHAASEATATVDLLRAARSWCGSNGVAWSGKLFLTGYSQGGHATLAAMRELEARHAEEFPVTAVVGGAGAYDLSGVTADEFLKNTPVPNPYYLAYLLAAYVDVYGLAGSLGELLAAPYSATVPPLFDGTRDSGALNAALPAVAAGAVRADYLAEFRARADHPLRRALQDNSLLEWTPRAPLRLYHCGGDRDVPPANAQVAYERFRARGAAQVELFNPVPDGDHGDCVEPTLLAALAWFETLR